MNFFLNIHEVVLRHGEHLRIFCEWPLTPDQGGGHAGAPSGQQTSKEHVIPLSDNKKITAAHWLLASCRVGFPLHSVAGSLHTVLKPHVNLFHPFVSPKTKKKKKKLEQLLAETRPERRIKNALKKQELSLKYFTLQSAVQRSVRTQPLLFFFF